MTATTARTPPPAPGMGRSRRRRTLALVTAGTVAAAGLGLGLAAGLGGGPSHATGSTYSYYRSVMARYGVGPGSMMGAPGSYGPAGGVPGYGWMMGGTGAPGWMTGGSLPGYMSGGTGAAGTGAGGTADPGTIMGSLFAGAPGPRVSAADAARLGAEVPAGAGVERAANRITFTGRTVALTVVASPTMPAESFRIAGLTDPTVVVPTGARVTIELINADGDMAHGLVVTAAGAAATWMPMAAAPPAFPGAAVWFLGDATPAGMHVADITFTASAPGSYRYLCPVPGHAQEGMIGTFTVG